MNTSELLASIMESGLPSRGVELKIHRMDYPFLMYHMFSASFETNKQDEIIERFIFSLMFEYMEKWRLSDSKNDSEKNRRGAFNFQRSVDLKKIIHEIHDRTEYSADVKISVSNAVLEMKRFGDAIGFKLKGGNSNPDDEHTNGTKILEAICNGDARSNLYVDKFIHSIECRIPLPRKDKENNAVLIDFSSVCSELIRACPYMSWSSRDKIINELTGVIYKNPSNECGPAKRAVIGDFRSLSVTAELIHFRGSEAQKSPQWRRGNIGTFGEDVYQFADGRDLCLSLQVECPFPQNTFLRGVDADLNAAKIQYDLRMAGATLYAQLCTMMNNVYSP